MQHVAPRNHICPNYTRKSAFYKPHVPHVRPQEAIMHTASLWYLSSTASCLTD